MRLLVNLQAKLYFAILDLKMFTAPVPLQVQIHRMAFGIKSASEFFLKECMKKPLQTFLESIIVADDIIMATMNNEEHNQILRQVLQREISM